MKILAYMLEKQQKIVNLVGTIVIAWILSALVASVFSWFLPGSSPLAPPANANGQADAMQLEAQQKNIAFYMPICERNLFDSTKQSPCTNAPIQNQVADTPSVDPNAAPVKSSIGAKLLGTMVSNLDKYSFATVQENGKKQPDNYRIGDMILGQAKIYEIVRNRVFFTNQGRKEYLEVANLTSVLNDSGSPVAAAASSAGVKVDGNKITVSKAKVDSTLQDLNQVIQQARMVPNYDAGQVTGFKIFGIRNGSIFKDLGLQNGDVINRINGTQIDSLEKALPMLQLLKTESSYTIDITRGGAKQSMDINIQ